MSSIRRKSFRKILTFFLLGSALYFLPDVWKMMTDGFSVARITSELPQGISWDTLPVSASEESALHCAVDQPYRYLGSGGQCFAFISQDNRYVIKFFKTRF